MFGGAWGCGVFILLVHFCFSGVLYVCLGCWGAGYPDSSRLSGASFLRVLGVRLGVYLRCWGFGVVCWWFSVGVCCFCVSSCSLVCKVLMISVGFLDGVFGYLLVL